MFEIKIIDFLCIWALLFIIFGLGLPILNEVYLANEHDVGYYHSAPNGFYKVILSHIDSKDRIVSFPVCPSSGSKLHGEFGFEDGLVFPEGFYGWIIVALYDNVVVWWKYV